MLLKEEEREGKKGMENSVLTDFRRQERVV